MIARSYCDRETGDRATVHYKASRVDGVGVLAADNLYARLSTALNRTLLISAVGQYQLAAAINLYCSAIYNIDRVSVQAEGDTPPRLAASCRSASHHSSDSMLLLQ